MPIVIKKRVSLEFLGEEYKDSYIDVRSISIGEYEKLGDATVKATVIDRLVGGEIKQDSGLVKITKDNIEELPGEVFVEAFGVMTGRLDPKQQGQLTNQSLTNVNPLQS